MKTISLLHPFSAQAIGLSEKDVFYSHSKPHEKALLHLQAAGYTVSISYFTAAIFPLAKRIHGIQKVFWPITRPLFKKRHAWRKQASFWHFLANSISAPDLTLINMSGHGSPYCFKLAKMLLGQGKVYIAMVGGMHYSDSKKAMAYYRGAHHIIVHTEIQKQQLLDNDLFKSIAIRVLPLGVDTELFCPRFIPTEIIKLIFVGRIVHLKQLELCLETVAHLVQNQPKAVLLKVIGMVSDTAYFEKLKKLTNKLHISENVVFVGAMAQQELVPYYQEANLMLLPSAHESFGMVMVEAMACGTPVAALKGSGGPDELVIDGITGLLCEQDEYSDRILNYFVSSQQEVLRENCRKAVEKNWSIARTSSILKAAVEDALHE